jgi:hypothetical protein
MTIDVAVPRVTRFSIGRVLRDSFVIFGRNILLFGGAALVVCLLSLFAPEAAGSNPDGRTDWMAYCLTTVLDVTISGLTEAAIVFATFQCLRGHRASTGDVAHGMRSAVPIVLASTIYDLPRQAMSIIEMIFPGQDVLTGVVAVGAMILTIVWWVYVPAIAIEGTGVLASFRRSAQLTKGRRWAIAGVYVVFTIGLVGPSMLIAATTGWSPASALSADPLTPFGAVGFAFQALTTAFFAVLVTVAYFYLRLEKEGAGVEDIVRVFD